MWHPFRVLVQGAIQRSRRFSPGCYVSPRWGERQGRQASFAIVAKLRRLNGVQHHSPECNSGIPANKSQIIPAPQRGATS